VSGVSTIGAPGAPPVAPDRPPTGAGPRVAETDRRFHAFVVDRLIAWSLDLAAVAVAQHYLLSRGHVFAGTLLVAATVLVVGGVFAVLVGLTGSTPGKALCGLRVVDTRTGRPVGVGPALVRTSIVGAATVPFGLGLAALAWTALADPGHLGRGWHDRRVSSLVVDRRPLAVVAESDESGPRAVVNLTAMRLVPARRTPLTAVVTAPGAVSAPEEEPPVWGLVFDTGERVRVDTIVLIGRRPEPRPGEQDARLVGLRSSDLSVSATHARVAIASAGTLVVTDLGSANGSVLRRQGVAKPLSGGRPATLLDGDVVHLGDRTMTVVRIGRTDPPGANLRRVVSGHGVLRQR
jgi:uncharacterized RDD family membrane protein YckC